MRPTHFEIGAVCGGVNSGLGHQGQTCAAQLGLETGKGCFLCETMPGCSIITCTNSWQKTKHISPPISYFVFPKDPKLRRIWIQKCQRGGKWSPDHARICSVHFSADQFMDDVEARVMNIHRPKKLKSNAEPNIKLPKIQGRIKRMKIDANIAKRLVIVGVIKTFESETNTDKKIKSEPDNDIENKSENYCKCDICRNLNIPSELCPSIDITCKIGNSICLDIPKSFDGWAKNENESLDKIMADLCHS